MSAALQTATRFVVNVLAADQEHISRRFASEDPDRFDGIGYQENRHGIAVLDGVLASIECEKQAEAAGGDHTVFFGLVTGGRSVTLPPVTSPKDRKSTRLNSSHGYISYAVFCLKKKKKIT